MKHIRSLFTRGTHTDGDTKSRRKWLGIPASIWGAIILLGAGIAIGVAIKESATDTFAGPAIVDGDVEIGTDTETEGIILDANEPAEWIPGTTTVTECISVELDNTTGSYAGDIKLYTGGVTGDLAQYLNVKVEKSLSTIGFAPGHFSCGGIDWETSPIVPETDLNTFDSTYADWTTGALIATVPSGTTEAWGLRFTYTMPATGDIVDGKTAENSIIFENRSIPS